MRRDELYNVGGFQPEHPSRNVLDEFEHGIPTCTPAEPCKCPKVTVRRYDRKGKAIEDRALTKAEREFFFAPEVPRTLADIAAVQALGDISVNERIHV